MKYLCLKNSNYVIMIKNSLQLSYSEKQNNS